MKSHEETWRLSRTTAAKCESLRKVMVRRNLHRIHRELSHKCDTHCNCERDMTCDDLREPVQLAIVHTLEKQRMDVANLFGNNLSTVKRLTHS